MGGGGWQKGKQLNFWTPDLERPLVESQPLSSACSGREFQESYSEVSAASTVGDPQQIPLVDWYCDNGLVASDSLLDESSKPPTFWKAAMLVPEVKVGIAFKDDFVSKLHKGDPTKQHGESCHGSSKIPKSPDSWSSHYTHTKASTSLVSGHIAGFLGAQPYHLAAAKAPPGLGNWGRLGDFKGPVDGSAFPPKGKSKIPHRTSILYISKWF